jgi:capsular polysaccharide export protein
VESGVTKYNLDGRRDVRIETGGRRPILVVGQVEGDKSVELGGFDIRTDSALLEAVRRNRPDGFIIYKPHPDVVSGNREGGAFGPEDGALWDALVSDVPLDALFPLADELHTLTSLSGFEALLRGVPVVTYGGPFYAGWGLTEDRLDFARRSRSLTLDELVAGVLILYPTYYDWETKLFCGPEVVLNRLRDRVEPDQGILRRKACGFLQAMLKLFR